MIQYEAVRDFEIVFADPPDAAMLLKPVLSKESIRAIEMDRGDEYTHVSDSEIVNSGNGESDSRSESQDRRVRQQQNATTTDNYSTKDTRAQPRCTKLVTKKDGTHQRLISLTLRFLLTLIPSLMNTPFLNSSVKRQGVWVGSFSTSKNGLCMDRMTQSLTAAEPQLSGISSSSLYTFYSRFVQLGKELMGFFGEDTDLEEKEKRLDDDLRRQQHDFRIQRTFLSEATIQLARLDLEYRMRSRAEAADGKQDKAGSQKRKAGHTFANDEDYVGPENDGEVTGEDEGGDDETLNEHNIYRLRKRVSTFQPSHPPLPAPLWTLQPQPQPQPPETIVEATWCSSLTLPPSTMLLPSTLPAQEQQQQQSFLPEESVILKHAADKHQERRAIITDPSTASIAQLSQNLQQAKAINDQLSHTLETTVQVQGESHLDKTLTSFKELLEHARQQRQAPRFSSHQGTPSTIANTPSTLPTAYLPATTTTTAASTRTNNNNNSSSSSNDLPQPTNHPLQTVNHPPGSFHSLEDMIRSFGQDLKVQISGLKTAFGNQQLQMIHLQSAVEDQQRQLTDMRNTLNNFISQSAPSNNHNSSNSNIGSNVSSGSSSGGGWSKSNGLPSTGPVSNAPIVAAPVPPPTTTRQTTTAGKRTKPLIFRSRTQKQYRSSSKAPPISTGPITSIVPARFDTALKTTATSNATQLAQRQAQQLPSPRKTTANTSNDADLSAAAEVLMLASTKATTAAVEKAGMRTTSKKSKLYRSAPSPPLQQPSPSQPPALVSIDTSEKSAWALDMITISEIAAAAVADIDRQLTKEQSMIQQWPSSYLESFRQRQQE